MAKKTPKLDLKVQSEWADDAYMSNLWKALRDVSRDVDPTVGFESTAHGQDAEATTAGPPAVPEAAVEPATAASEVAQNIVAPPAERPDGPRPASPVRRPLSAPRARPAAAATPAEPKERLAPLQSPLRRPLGTALQFDPPKDNNVVRPPQFNPVAGPAPGPSWASPLSAVPETTVAAPEVRAPGPAAPPRPRLASILESRLPEPSGPVEPRVAPAGPRLAASPPPAAAPAPYGIGAGAPRSSSGVRPAMNGTSIAPSTGLPSTGLPDALKPFAPGAPNIQMDMAALSLSPRWKP
ncbi:MAG: hypothetical protein QOF30_876, partial [Acidimicrobiaceae bacterium]|nr:hypothetical protein [Acidimicrobiaceae bacterium]